MISKDKAIELIESTQGQFFSVQFTKKDKTVRQMTARLGVRKGVKGVGRRYNPKDYGLIGVYDVNKLEEGKDEKGAFRMINVNTLNWIKVGGKVYMVGDIE